MCKLKIVIIIIMIDDNDGNLHYFKAESCPMISGTLILPCLFAACFCFFLVLVSSPVFYLIFLNESVTIN